ncbi:MAG TPA: FAD-dependent oxidoreductase [Methylovirgula sp.]|nr:FAD-dependent oxidoreductase [Methylovirgula sp.]
MIETLVIGGGPAGAALAAHLARRGQGVLLIERQSGPHHKVCGEFLSEEAVFYLYELGIDPEKLGAVPITNVSLAAGKSPIDVPLPFVAMSLSRRVLDEALLQRAVDLGAEILRGRTVKSLQREEGRWAAALDDGRSILARHAFLATGKHDLRDWRRPPGRQSDLLAFKLHWRLRTEAALNSEVELFFFPGGYAGLEPIEGGLANLCLVVRGARFAAIGSKWEALHEALLRACPHLRRRLEGAEPCWARPLAVAAIPYGFVQTRSEGIWRLGDQAACIPSFAGDGIAIALHSAHLAAQFYCRGAGAPEFQARLASDIMGQVSRATLLSKMLVDPAGQVLAAAAARMMPELLGFVARRTRIPKHQRYGTRLPA